MQNLCQIWQYRLNITWFSKQIFAFWNWKLEIPSKKLCNMATVLVLIYNISLRLLFLIARSRGLIQGVRKVCTTFCFWITLQDLHRKGWNSGIMLSMSGHFFSKKYCGIWLHTDWDNTGQTRPSVLTRLPRYRHEDILAGVPYWELVLGQIF